MNTMCFREKSGIKRLGYIQNYDSYGDELQNIISECFNYNVLDHFIDNEIDSGHIYYYDKHFDPVADDCNEVKYKIVNTGYFEMNTRQHIYAGFEMKKTWCGVTFGTKKDIFSKWENENPERDVYSTIFFRYTNSLASVLYKFTSKEADEQYVKKVIEDSYINAFETGELHIFVSDVGKSFLYFYSGLQADDGEKIWLISEPNLRETAQQKWFGLFFIKQSELIKRIFNMNHFNISGLVFKDSCEANSFVNSLAEKAINENWEGYSAIKGTYSLPVLKGYLENTYARLCKEAETQSNKLVKKNGFAYFNSGLLDKFYRQIFIRGNICTESRYIDGVGNCEFSFLSDLKMYSENDPCIAMVLASGELPEIASYCDNYQNLIFDPTLEIKLHDNHIFEDGVRRGRLPIYYEDYESCKDNSEKYDYLMSNISQAFDAAIKRMVLLSKRNYTIAVPQYVKDLNEIQFMLPIYLRENNNFPDCVLSLRLETDAPTPYYTGTTILTPEMAINNARLISGPELHWIDDIKAA